MTRLTRDDIIAGAGERFATHGYHGTSMRGLGDDLGILGSSIYSHVGGKQELFVAVVEQGARLFDDAATEATKDDCEPDKRLCRLITGHLGVLMDHRPQARTYLAEVDFLDPEDRVLVQEIRDRYERVYTDTLTDGVRSGVFKSDIDPRLATVYVLSILNSSIRWFDDAGRLSRDAVADDICDFVLSGLS